MTGFLMENSNFRWTLWAFLALVLVGCYIKCGTSTDYTPSYAVVVDTGDTDAS
jgi:hypothetical protein